MLSILFWLALAVLVMSAATVPLIVHLGFRAPRVRERASPADFGLPFREVRIPTRRGRHLFGWWLPAPDASRTVVVLHGWGSNAGQMLPAAVPLRRAGLNVLLFDARCHGRSDGDTFASLPRFAEDLGCVIAWLREGQPPTAVAAAVLGHSVGAGAALLAATREPGIAAVVSIAAFADPALVTERYLRSLRPPRWLLRLVIRYTQWLIGHSFEDIAPIRTICRVQCPVLLVHGLEDRTVPVADARAIAGACPSPRLRLLELPGAGHACTEALEHEADELLTFLADAWHDECSAAGAGR